ncbi:uncharacterized protein LOC129585408 isoform X2 [Paramacrobiotus metropolitanus]|uniref:uncharacterized protein LOC129585408 isoform X2 n=1 Tax=Paramacrobiotus metropolitanus TaxID=2943436 RepID=UPI002445C1F3|nr:uncharacterized protein LOC129585408 isoform X2 [Paramacrobiotus metropolitanus]XP_055334086.1 uncharacterized protein LOC129585408 isoform X2 [Paramacrobiotus metropolitanus]
MSNRVFRPSRGRSAQDRDHYHQRQVQHRNAGTFPEFPPNPFDPVCGFPLPNDTMPVNSQSSFSHAPSNSSARYSNPLLWNVPRGPPVQPLGSRYPLLDTPKFPPPEEPMGVPPYSNVGSTRMPVHDSSAYLTGSRASSYYRSFNRKKPQRQRGRTRPFSPRVTNILARKNFGGNRGAPYCPPFRTDAERMPGHCDSRGFNTDLRGSLEHRARIVNVAEPRNGVPVMSKDETLKLVDASSEILSKVDVPALLDSIKRLDVLASSVEETPVFPSAENETAVPCYVPKSPSPAPSPLDPDHGVVMNVLFTLPQPLDVGCSVHTEGVADYPTGLNQRNGAQNASACATPMELVISTDVPTNPEPLPRVALSDTEPAHNISLMQTPYDFANGLDPTSVGITHGCSPSNNDTVHSSHGLLGYRSMPHMDIRQSRLEDFDDYECMENPRIDFSSFGDRTSDRKPVFCDTRDIVKIHRLADGRRKSSKPNSRYSDWEPCSDEEKSHDKRDRKRKNHGKSDRRKKSAATKISKSSSKNSQATRTIRSSGKLERKSSKHSRESGAIKKKKLKSIVVKPDVHWMELHCSSDESDTNFPKVASVLRDIGLDEKLNDGTLTSSAVDVGVVKFESEVDPDFFSERLIRFGTFETCSTTKIVDSARLDFDLFDPDLLNLDCDLLEDPGDDLVGRTEDDLRALLVASLNESGGDDESNKASVNEKKVLCVGQDGKMAWSDNSVSFNFASLLPSTADNKDIPKPEITMSPKKNGADNKKKRIVKLEVGPKEPGSSSSRTSSTDRSQASTSSFFSRLICNSVDAVTPEVLLGANFASDSANLFPEPSSEKKRFRTAKFETLPMLSVANANVVKTKTAPDNAVAHPIPVIGTVNTTLPSGATKKTKKKKSKRKSSVKLLDNPKKIKLPAPQNVSRLENVAASQKENLEYRRSLNPAILCARIQTLETEVEEAYWEDIEVNDRIYNLEKSLRAAVAQRSRISIHLHDLRMKADEILQEGADVPVINSEDTEATLPIEPVDDPFVRLSKKPTSPTLTAAENSEIPEDFDELICPNYIRMPPWNASVVERPLSLDDDPLLRALRNLKTRLSNTGLEMRGSDQETSILDDLTDAETQLEVMESVDSVGYSEISRQTFVYISETLRNLGLYRFQKGFAGIGKRNPFTEAFIVEIDPHIAYCFCGKESSCIKFHIPLISVEGRREKIQQELTKLIFDVCDTADDLLHWKAAIDDLENEIQDDELYELEAAKLWEIFVEKLPVQ